MAIREHTDRTGSRWQVWHVIPTGRNSARPEGEERRREDLPTQHGDRRRRPSVLTPGMEGGWLCFESPHEKRRLVPVPADWESCEPVRLQTYLDQARPIRRRVLEPPPDPTPT